MSTTMQYDVAIIGGGPGGSTTGSYLRKYDPSLRVIILEKEQFPREHVGESQLPPISRVLNDIGAWDKVEAAGFPIKIGATYTWGRTTDPWVFGFVPLSDVVDEPRPGSFDSWRQRVAFQVDRAIYDEILLGHAQELGCEVRQQCRVSRIVHRDGAVSSLELESGESISARHYVDASGNAAVLRRALGVEVNVPTMLKNVAFWNYWSRPGLNDGIMEKGTARVLIRSVPFGWLWYIALGPDRTSVGLVCPGDYYKSAGKRPEQLYAEAISCEKQIAGLLRDAATDRPVLTTTDWSFVADKAYGPNWFLCGECLGFADPILAAGLTLTHTCAEHCAFTILELDRGEHDPEWLKSQYQSIQKKRVVQHMRFAEYWYSANGCFSDIHENCSRIAKEAGLRLDPAEAFRWLSNGGIDDMPGQVAIGGLDLAGIKQVQQRLSHKTVSGEYSYLINGKSDFKLNLNGAKKTTVASISSGRVHPTVAYVRGPNTLVLIGGYEMLVSAIQGGATTAEALVANIRGALSLQVSPSMLQLAFNQVMQCLEMMAVNYWVSCSTSRGRAVITMSTPKEGQLIYSADLGPPAKSS